MAKTISKTTKKKLKSIKKNLEMPFILAAGLVFLLAVFVSSLSLIGNLHKPTNSESSILSSKNSLFAGQNSIPLAESPELRIVQNNSLVGNSYPTVVSPRVLGSLVGESPEPRTTKEIKKYVVQAGDTLSKIAVNFGISVNTLIWANNLSQNSILRPSQELIVLPISGIMHLVQAGDTVDGLAKQYKADAKDIIAFNELGPEGKIFIGDVLIIPGATMPSRSLTSSAQIPVGSSYFIFPTQGTISQGLHWYNAIDIANQCGTPVRAAAGGKVQKAGWIERGGNRVRILHPNNIVTYYGHLSKIVVKIGQRVSQGQLVGYMGHSGYTIPAGRTGCHLHFDVRGTVNPLAKYPVGSYVSWK